MYVVFADINIDLRGYIIMTMMKKILEKILRLLSSPDGIIKLNNYDRMLNRYRKK